MTTVQLPSGEIRYDNRRMGYSMTFPPGWVVNEELARHDFQATCGGESSAGILGVNVFTQFLPELASQSKQDFLDNFGHGDFGAMVLDSFQASFDIRPRGQTPIRQREVNGLVWFFGDYHLAARSNGARSELRYAFTFLRGCLFHVKAFLDAGRLAASEAAVERLIEGFSANVEG